MPENHRFPALRADVTRIDDSALHDALFDRRIDLGPATAAMVALLDGRPLEDVAAALAVEHGPRARVESMLRRFLLLGLIEGSSPRAVARLRAVRGGEALPHVVLEGSRFGCQGSGACCRDHRLGPLTDDDVARLPAGAVVVLPREPQGEEARYLRQIDGRCMFLTDDDRCGLHARGGAEAKPGFCRLFPLEALATLDGVKVYDRGSCATFAVSARSGLPLSAEASMLSAVLRPGPLHHPVVRFDDRLVADYGHYLAFVRAGIDICARAGEAGAALAALGRLLVALAAALAGCPLREGEPDTSLDELFAGGAARWHQPASPGEMQEGAEMLSVVAADLQAGREDALAAFGARLGAEMMDLVDAVAVEAGRLAEGRTSDMALAPEVGEVLRLSLRQQLFGRRSLLGDRPWPALARMAFLAFAAACGGRRAARAAGRARVEAADISHAHSLAARLTDVRAAAIVFVQHEELAPAILMAGPLLLG